MRYTHSAVGLKRLSLPLACWELGFVLRVAPLPAFLLLLAGPGPCGVCRVVISLDTPIALCEQERSFLCPSTRLTRQAGGNQAWPVGKRK